MSGGGGTFYRVFKDEKLNVIIKVDYYGMKKMSVAVLNELGKLTLVNERLPAYGLHKSVFTDYPNAVTLPQYRKLRKAHKTGK